MAHERTTFFTLDRKLLEGDFWLSEKFSKPQAWVDLIGLANYGDLKRFEGAELKTYKRGQVVTSVRTLAERWKWSQEKVRNFLTALEGDGMASTKKSARGVVVTIENYSFYQDVEPKTERETENRPSTDRALTEHRPRQKNNTNNTNNTTNSVREGLRPCGPGGRLTLTAEEERQFRELYPEEADRFMEELDEYKGASGRKYSNDFEALKRWARNDAKFTRTRDTGSRYKSGLEKITEEIENGTFSF